MNIVALTTKCSFIVGVLYIIVIYLVTTLYKKTLYNYLVGVEPTYTLRYFCLAKQFHNHLGIQLPKQLQVVIKRLYVNG